jgi:hypothetical protein
MASTAAGVEGSGILVGGPGSRQVRNEVAPAGPRRSRRVRLNVSTTPGRLRLLLAILVLLSLGWGALAAFAVQQYASAASGVVDTREPLSLDALQIYQRLSDANDAAATAFLTGGLEPFTVRQRYLADISAAERALEDATARGGEGNGVTSADLRTLAIDLPVYTGEIETARADNRLGLPLGAAYLREASALMRAALLPAAQRLDDAENSSQGTTSAQATGAPLIAVTLAVGLGLGGVLYLASRWLRRRTNRVLNAGLVVAGAVVVVSLAWLAIAYSGGRSDLLAAQARGSTPVAALARVDIAAQQAHADESLTLIDNSGDDVYQQDYLAEERALGPGPGTLLTAAATAAAGGPAASAVTSVVRDAKMWSVDHASLRALDDSGKHAAAVQSALGSGSGEAGRWFTLLSADLNTAMAESQAAFDSPARAGAGAYAGLEAGVVIAALVIAAGCAWGLGRRIAEYR